MIRSMKKQIIIFVAFIVALMLAHLLQYLSKDNYSAGINAESISKTLSDEIEWADKEFQELIRKSTAEKPDSVVFYRYTELFRTKQSGIFVYDSTQLIAWSTNRIPAPLHADSLNADRQIIQLADGSYLSRISKYNNYTYVYLFLVYHEYSYKNEFLNEGFNPVLNIPDGCEYRQFSNPGFIAVNYDKSALFYIEETAASHPVSFLPPVVFFAAFLLFAWFLASLSVYLIKMNINALLILTALAADMVLLRFFMLKFHYPIAFSLLELFTPEYYAESFWLPSPGDLGLNLILLSVWIGVFCRHFNPSFNKVKKSTTIILSVSVAVVIFTIQWLTGNRIESFIINSSVEIDPERILRFSQYSIFMLAMMMLLLVGVIVFIDRLISVFAKQIHFVSFAVALVAVTVIWFLVGRHQFSELIGPCIFMLIAFTAFWVHRNVHSYNWYAHIIILFLISLFLSEKALQVVSEKELESRKVLANNLANERDAGAEFFLTNTGNDIMQDSKIESFVLASKADSLYQYIQSNYIKGYLNKYDLQVSLCTPTDSLLVQPDNTMCHCFSFFGELLRDNGIPLPGTNFYFLDNHDGRISYFGYYSYEEPGNPSVQMFIELNSKLFSEGLGYPELLLDKKYAQKKTLKDYSYAKYNRGRLIIKKGEFEYPLNIGFNRDTSDFMLNEVNGYSHLYYYPDDENIIVMSIEETGFQRHLISFSYLFFVIFTGFSLFQLGKRIGRKKETDTGSLKNRIQFSIVFIIVLSILIIGSISIYFIIDGYAERHNQMLRDKLQSVMVELEHKIGDETEFNETNTSYINSLLVKFSNVFYTDINLFDTHGNLIASSREEVFDKGLQGRFMHPKAVRQLRQKNTGSVIISERIGKADYLSAYVPFRNNQGEVVAYINLPYFSRQDELNKEITDFAMAFANVFLLLIMLSVVMGIFIANQLTKPLAYLQEKIKTIDLGTKSEKIEYDRKDELGSLIREYNKKIDELAESAGMLAKSERESAWREMAKQIAHEIKNPLTPMKLSIQHLKQTYTPNNPEWQQTLDKVTQTIIEQIDTLSAIASEFSNFAKMPQARMQQVDLGEKIISSVNLFRSSYEDIDFEIRIVTDSKAIIDADPEQMTRVFNNLIKNSIQAIEEHTKGKISLHLTGDSEHYLFAITDNGSGIDSEMQSKIFQPNFTTKSSGMGLGLSMVKNIIDQMGAKIWFETTPAIGTSFYIRFKKPQEEASRFLM